MYNRLLHIIYMHISIYNLTESVLEHLFDYQFQVYIYRLPSSCILWSNEHWQRARSQTTKQAGQSPDSYNGNGAHCS